MVPVRRMRWALLAAMLVWVTSLVPSGARAQADLSADTPPEAIEFYRQAREFYEAGAYRDAAQALERALVLDPDSPTLVFNLARVYELLGDLDRSLRYYEHYQRLLPQQQAREQERAEATIRRLQGARESDALQSPTPVEVQPLMQLPGIVLVRENGVADTGFWITLSVGAIAVAGGAVLGGLALDARASAEAFVLGPDGLTQDSRNSRYQVATSLGISTDITLGVGGALVITAGLLYFLREHTVERAPVRAVETADDASDEATESTEPSTEPSTGPSTGPSVSLEASVSVGPDAATAIVWGSF